MMAFTNTVTLSLVRISCGGISYVNVLMSILTYISMQGITKKTPGPEAPPDRSLPSLKMTARSYSWTTLTVKRRDRGKVTMIRSTEARVSRFAHTPGPSSHAGKFL